MGRYAPKYNNQVYPEIIIKNMDSENCKKYGKIYYYYY